MKKVIVLLLVIVLIAVAVFIGARNIIAKNMIEKGVRDSVGQELSIGRINIGVVTPDLRIKDLQVHNPSGYTEKLLAEVPDLFVNYALIDIIKGFIHFPELRINIKQINVEKDKNGVMNIDRFKPETKEGDKNEESSAKVDKSDKKQFLVNKFVLEIGTVRYRDASKTPSTEKEYQINFSKEFSNVSDERVIIDAIFSAVASKLIAEGIGTAIDTLMKGGIKNKGSTQNTATTKSSAKGQTSQSEGVNSLIKDLTSNKEDSNTGNSKKQTIKLPF